MKIKKILSGIVAGALAISTLASISSFSTSAADEVIWEGTAEIPTWSTKEVSLGVAGIPLAVEGGVLTIEGEADANAQVQIATKQGEDWTWTVLTTADGDEAFNVPTSGKLQVKLTADQAALLASSREMLLKGQNITVTKVSYSDGIPTGEEEIIWEGTAEIPTWSTKEVSLGVAGIPLAEKDGTLTVYGEAGSNAQVQIATKQGADWTWTVLTTATGDEAFDVPTSGKLQVKLTADQAAILASSKEMLLKGQNITVTKVTYTAPVGTPTPGPVDPDPSSSESQAEESSSTTGETPIIEMLHSLIKYQLRDSETGTGKDMRFVAVVAQDQVEGAAGFDWFIEAARADSPDNFEILNDEENPDVNIEGTKAYKSIIADGKKITANEVAEAYKATKPWVNAADEFCFVVSDKYGSFNTGDFVRGELFFINYANWESRLVEIGKADPTPSSSTSEPDSSSTTKPDSSSTTEQPTEAEVIWEGTAAIPTWSTKEVSLGVANIPLAEEGGILTIYGEADANAQVQIATKQGADWTWTVLTTATGDEAFNIPTSGKLQIVLTAEQAALLQSSKEILLKGQNITVTKVTYGGTTPPGQEEEIWTGTADIPTWSTKEFSLGVAGIPTAKENGILTIYAEAGSNAQVQIATKQGADWTWTVLTTATGDEAFDVPTSGKLQIKLTADQAALLASSKEMLLKGQNIVVTKVTYTAPAGDSSSTTKPDSSSTTKPDSSSTTKPDSSSTTDKPTDAEVIWEGTAAIPTWSTKEVSLGVANIPLAEEGGILTIYGEADANAQVQIATKQGADWTWTVLTTATGDEAFNIPTSGKLQIVLTAEQADLLASSKEILLKGQNITVTKVTYGGSTPAGEEEEIWAGTADIPTWSTKEVSLGVAGIPTAKANGILTIYAEAGANAQVQIATKQGADWTWTVLTTATGDEAFDVPTSGKLQIKLTADQASILASSKEMLLKGQNITVTKVTYTAM